MIYTLKTMMEGFIVDKMLKVLIYVKIKTINMLVLSKDLFLDFVMLMLMVKDSFVLKNNKVFILMLIEYFKFY